MIDMIDIYRKLRDNYSQGDLVQVQLVVPLMNRFIVHFTHEDNSEQKRYMIAIFNEKGIAQIIEAGDI
jgi:threonyl-tRNA synthetase